MSDADTEWQMMSDSERPGAFLFSLLVKGLGMLTVQEVAVGDWGWTLSRLEDGFPIDFQYGYSEAASAKRAACDRYLTNDRPGAD